MLWGWSHELVGASTFSSQGSSLLLAGPDPSAPTGNVVWGNSFDDSATHPPSMYPGSGYANGTPFGIFAFESGDLILDNEVGTAITAYAPNVNMFSGAGQLNRESWNLSMVEPAQFVTSFSGDDLAGTIVPSRWQGESSWGDDQSGSALPSNASGLIATGGDEFPLPITAFDVTFYVSHLARSVTWSVTVNEVAERTSGSTLTFYEVAGSYAYRAAVLLGGGSLNPSSGNVTVVSVNVSVSITYV